MYYTNIINGWLDLKKDLLIKQHTLLQQKEPLLQKTNNSNNSVGNR